MPELDDYVDARELDDAFERHVCPECGVYRWFRKHPNRFERDYWYCDQCNNHRRHILEYPCPECDVRMVLDGGNFRCQNDACPTDAIEVDKDALIDRLSGTSHMVRGMPGTLMGYCPFCGVNRVNGGPDGELECRNCSDLYAGRYSDQWYCYAIWMQEPEKITVNEL